MELQSTNGRPQSASLEAKRRDAVIEAAKDLIGEGGLERMTIRAVIERAGLARRAFYDAFDGKDDLILAVFADTVERAALHVARLSSGHSNPLACIHTMIETIFSIHPHGEWQSARTDRFGKAMSREHLRLAQDWPVELQHALQPLLTLLSKWLKEGMSLGLVREDDPDRFALMIYNLVSTTAHSHFIGSSVHDRLMKRRAMLAEEAWQFCRRAIAP